MGRLIAAFKTSKLPRILYWAYAGYLKLRRPRTLGVRTIVEDEAGRILLVRHTYRPGWFLPGGGVKKWETVQDAAIRETREETGICVHAVSGPIGVFAHFNEKRCDHVVLFEADGFTSSTSSSFEIAEARFFAPNDLPEDISPSTLRRLEERRQRRQASLHW